MRLRTIASIAAATTVIALLPTAPAAAGKPAACNDVFAKVSTAPVDDLVEVGEIAGLVNGAIYIRYPVKESTVKPPNTKPNVVITTKAGTISFWMSITGIQLPDGTHMHQMTTLRATGTGDFARASINFTIDGTHYPGKGGEYEVIGAICKPTVIGPAK